MARSVWLVLILLLTLPIAVVPGSSGTASASFSDEPRVLTFEPVGDGFKADSARTSEVADDTWEATFSSSTQRLAFFYFDRRDPNATGQRITVRFEAVVEYEDANGDQAYGLGDQVLNRIPLVGLTSAHMDVSGFGGDGRVVRLSSDLPPAQGGGEFRQAFWLLSDAQTVDGRSVRPTTVPFDVEVRDFGFHSNTSRIAVETHVLADPSPRESVDEIASSGSGPHAFYRWPGESDVDGSARPLRVTLLAPANGRSENDGSLVLHSYERGQDASYGPTIGVEPTQSGPAAVLKHFISNGDWRLYGVGVLVAAGLVAVGIARRGRQN